MEKEDIEEFREAIQRMSDEDGEGKRESSLMDDREKMLEKYQQEASQLEKEKEVLQMENSLLLSSVNNGVGSSKSDLDYKADAVDESEILPDNDQDRDDLSSIFSEDEEDLRSLVEGSDTIRKALKNLRKERDFWIADTASETSDDGDTSVSTNRSLRDATADRIQISKLLAEKEFLELKLSQVANEKKDTETKLKYMEKEKTESKRRQEKHSMNSRLDQSQPIRHSPRIENKMQPSKQGPSKQGDHKKSKEAHKQHTHRHKDHSESAVMSNAELLQFLRSRSISPQLVKGYEDDIALLAQENAKFGEIIDHLHIHPEEEPSPRVDPMAAFVDAYEHRVPQDEYMRLESEKKRLEHLVREKDRQIKERDRIFEETKFEFEDEMKLLKDALKRMENKMREKTREVNEYEIQILELKSSFEEQFLNVESELHLRNEQNMRLEEVNVSLVENNQKCQKEIEHLKSNLSKLSAREKEIEKKYSNDLKMLEEKFLNENREKTQLSGNLEGLMSDLMILKNKLLEDGSKTARMRQGFEKERMNLNGEDLDVDPRFTNLTLHLRNRGHDENDGHPSTETMIESHLTNQESVAMETTQINLSMQPVQQPDISEYLMLIQQQKEKIEMLEKANQELSAKLVQFSQKQQKRFSDVSIVHCEIVQDQSQTSTDVSPEPDIQINDQSYQIGDVLPEDRSVTKCVPPLMQDQQKLGTPSPSPRPSSALQHEMNELEQENMYLKNKLEDLGNEKMKRRELEEKNEELQEEVSQMARKRSELQRKQDHMSNEIDGMNEKVEVLEKSNAKLSKEVDQLTNMIKEMEESFNEEKANLTLKFAKERDRKEKELNKSFGKEQERLKEMEEEIEKLQDENDLLTKQNKDLKNKYNREIRNARDIDDKESEEEIEKLKDEITSLIKQTKDMKNKYSKEIENLKRQHEEEIDNLTQLQGDGKQNLDHLRRVEEQWKTKLDNTIQKYEEQLKRLEREKEELLNRSGVAQGIRGISEQNTQQNFTQIITSERPIENQNISPTFCQASEVENELVPEGAHVFAPTIESEVPLENKTSAQMLTPSETREELLDDLMANDDQETVGLAKVMSIDDYVPNNDRESLAQTDNEGVKSRAFTPSYSITEIPLEDEPDDTPRTSGERVTVEIPAKKVSDTTVDVQRIPIDDRREVEYTSIMPNLQIQVELETDEGRERRLPGERNNDEQIKELENQRTQLQNALNQKQNEILSLMQKITQLEQQLIGKSRDIAALQDKERNANVIFQDKIDEKSRYYQDLLEKLKSTLQGEKKELEQRLSKESEEMQKLMKEEFQKSLSSKSGILENRIHELVADKVKSYKEQIQKLEMQLKEEKEKIKQFENGEDERTKRLEREKKVLRVTIQALSKELNKAKQDRKDIKKEYKKNKAEWKKSAEEERNNFEESLEKAKEVQKLKIEEELRNKYSIDVEKYEQKLEKMNEEIQQYETKVEEMVIRFREEKFKLENDLQDSLNELESMTEAQAEFRISVEDEYKRKLRKEKQNIENTLESLRQEITKLRENRQQIESQLQQNAHYKHEMDSGCTTHTQVQETNILNNKEIFNRIENEYQQQLQREKQYYDSKIQDLENDYDSLTNEISHLKSKHRQDRMMMKSEFEKEKAFLEDKFEREKRDIQASIHLRLHNMRDPRISQNFPRDIRLQNEIDILQQKISRLEDLSPRMIDMAQRTALYDGQRFQSSHQGSSLQIPGRPTIHHGSQYGMTNEMLNNSRSLDVSPQYSGINISGQDITQEAQNDEQQTTTATSAHSNEGMGDSNIDVSNIGVGVVDNYEGGYHDQIISNEEMSSNMQDSNVPDNAPLSVDNEKS